MTRRSDFMKEFYLEDIHAYGIDRETFTIWVNSDPDIIPHASDEIVEKGVNYLMADRFEKNLQILANIDPHRPILVNLSSCGGDWVEGMKMLSAILYSPNPITVLGTKWCRSMTSMIPLGADRFILRPPAQYMIHDGMCAVVGTIKQAETAFVDIKEMKRIMMNLYVNRLSNGKKFNSYTFSEIQKILRNRMDKEEDVFFTTKEAVEWGFVDGIPEQFPNLRIPKINTKRRNQVKKILYEKD